MLLDTCALLWRAFEPEKLSKKASRALEKADDFFISSISIWEIAIKIKNNKLKIPISVEYFVKQLRQVKKFRIIPVDENIWMSSVALQWKHRDPADRVIVATAESLNNSVNDFGLISSDKLIAQYYKKTIW